MELSKLLPSAPHLMKSQEMILQNMKGTFQTEIPGMELPNGVVNKHKEQVFLSSFYVP